MLDALSNVPVLVWFDGDEYVADCVFIPRCRAHAPSRHAVLVALARLVQQRLDARSSEGWDLPDTYEVVQLATRVRLAPRE